MPIGNGVSHRKCGNETKRGVFGMSSETLEQAKRNRADEFYTQLSDIEAALRHFSAQLRGKTVYCSCDDPLESNFFRYFALNFRALGLKKLIATCCRRPFAAGRPGTDGLPARPARHIEITSAPERWPEGLDSEALVRL